MVNSLLTTKELAELLNISGKTVFRYRKEGLPFIRINDRAFRYDREKVMEWINTRYDSDNQDRA